MAVTTSNPTLPNLNQNNLEKIESFLNDSAYKEALESSANFNTRICIERKMRVPFFDSQTCIAQNHSQLFQPKRNRIPGLLPGQIYSYPRPRWRKKRRQYLILQSRMLARVAEGGLDGEVDLHNISTVENPALQDTDSKDSQLLKDDVTKEWLYDDGDMFEMDGYDEPDPDSDFDYEESSYKRRKARKGGGRGRGSAIDSPSGVSRRGGRGGGRGRKKAMPSYEPVPGDPDKPFACELCGARYKTRPGLTYHYGHSHRDGASDENSRESVPSSSGASSSMGASSGNPGGISFAGQTVVSAGGMGGGGIMGVNSGAPPFGADIIGGPSAPPNLTAVGNNNTPSATVLGPQQVYQDSYVTFLNHPAGTA